jgi:hypothetical protein
MFLFRMHSIGSVRPVPRASAVANQWWGGGKPLQEPMEQPEVEPTQNQLEEEDVVVIQEEEMVLVRKEQQQPHQEEQESQPEEQPHQEEQESQPEEQPQQEQQEPQPQCMEPESTVVEPPSKSKYKKKQQKRK